MRSPNGKRARGGNVRRRDTRPSQPNTNTNVNTNVDRRPVFRVPSNTQNRSATPAEQSSSQSSDSPPATPTTRHSALRSPSRTFNMNENHPAAQAQSTPTMSPASAVSPNRQYPTFRNNQQNWIFLQDRKFRVSNLPRDCGTRQVYELLCGFGKIVKIELSRSVAWVTYQ